MFADPDLTKAFQAARITFDPFTVDFWIPVGVCLLCGTIVGLERQIRGKPAGIRTLSLICLSTMLFVGLGASLFQHPDPSRVLGQIVTGVGFLGAGVIISREGELQGVTTAALIWMLAAIGAAIGLGHNAAAIAAAVICVGVLTGVEYMETLLIRIGRRVQGKEKEGP